MNSRERMLAAINRQPVDRIPTDIWTTQEVWRKLRNHFGEGADIMSELHIDGMNAVSPAYIGPALPKMPEGEFIDYYGLRSKAIPHEGGAYAEVIHHPLAEASHEPTLAGGHEVRTSVVLMQGDRNQWHHYAAVCPPRGGMPDNVTWLQIQIYSYWPAGTYLWDNVHLYKDPNQKVPLTEQQPRTPDYSKPGAIREKAKGPKKQPKK